MYRASRMLAQTNKENEMFASQYTRYLPEVGEPMNYRVRLIERLSHQRAVLLLQASALQNEIAAEEIDLEAEITKTWKKSEIKAAKKEASEV